MAKKSGIRKRKGGAIPPTGTPGSKDHGVHQPSWLMQGPDKKKSGPCEPS